MNRHEAMLRELNLYPQWTLRTPVEQAVAAETTVQPEPIIEQVAATVTEPVAFVPDSSLVEESPVGASLLAKEIREQARSHDGQSEFVPANTWPELKQQVRDCERCGLRAGCTQTVFGVGNEKADWLFVGEGPGAEEDALGEPFVGEAGKLLDNMLAAIKLTRGKQAYIANVVKCHPPENRNPAADEIAQCLPYLARQIELIQPKLIVALGKVAAANLLGEDVPLDTLRGTLHDYHGIPLIVTYHPAYLLRRPSAKAKAWQDLCFAVDVMQEV